MVCSGGLGTQIQNIKLAIVLLAVFRQLILVLCIFQTHLPGYLEQFDAIKGKGVDVVACVAVNDPFVMDAWGKAQGASGKVSTAESLC